MTKPITREDRWLKNIAREWLWNKKGTRVPSKVAEKLVRWGHAGAADDAGRPAPGVDLLVPTFNGLARAFRLGLRPSRKGAKDS